MRNHFKATMRVTTTRCAPVWIGFAGSSDNSLVAGCHVHPVQTGCRSATKDNHHHQGTDRGVTIYIIPVSVYSSRKGIWLFLLFLDTDLGKVPAVVRRTLEENKFPFLHLLLLRKHLMKQACQGLCIKLFWSGSSRGDPTLG